MPVYNEPIEYITQAVESIRCQTYKNIELVIVVDNPSHQQAIEYLTGVSDSDSRIKVYINQLNQGLPRTLNKAITLSHGDLIARMDSDDWSTKKRIEVQVEYINNVGVDLVASNVVDMDELGNLLGTRTKYPTSSRRINKYLKYGDCLPHPTWLGKRRIFESLEGYREIEGCEDYDFLVRGAILGYNYDLITEPLLHYRINMKGISQTKEAKQIAASKIIQKSYKMGQVATIDELTDASFNMALDEVEKYLEEKKKGISNIVNLMANKLFYDDIKNKILRQCCLKI